MSCLPLPRLKTAIGGRRLEQVAPSQHHTRAWCREAAGFPSDTACGCAILGKGEGVYILARSRGDVMCEERSDTQPSGGEREGKGEERPHAWADGPNPACRGDAVDSSCGAMGTWLLAACAGLAERRRGRNHEGVNVFIMTGAATMWA
jgi:hypothetical protein